MGRRHDAVPSTGEPDGEGGGVLTERPPHGLGRASGAIAVCLARTASQLYRREISQPRERVGHVLHFSDGTSGQVYRETRSRCRRLEQPTTLLVGFRLRYVHGHGHRLFRAESLLNTVLFAGFPGFRSKLWLAHDTNDLYRGVYEWDGAAGAESYARSLWWALALVSERSSIHYVAIPDLRRDDLLHDPEILRTVAPSGGGEWWRLRCYSEAAGDVAVR